MSWGELGRAGLSLSLGRCRGFADDPWRGQEKAAPNAAAKCAFRLVIGVTMALPRETIAFRLSGI